MKVLFLDDNPERHRAMDEIYQPKHEVFHCYTLNDFVGALENVDHFDVVSLDHDLNDFETESLAHDGSEATGLDACGFLVREHIRVKLPRCIMVHSVNPCVAHNMRAFLQGRGFAVNWVPFCAGDTGDENGYSGNAPQKGRYA